jgi:hypothetical protein
MLTPRQLTLCQFDRGNGHEFEKKSHRRTTMKENDQNRTAAGLTLLTGGNGKVGSRLARRLESRGVALRIGSRSGTPAFDWADAGTWDAALNGVTAACIAYVPDLAVPGAAATIRDFVRRVAARGSWDADTAEAVA